MKFILHILTNRAINQALVIIFFTSVSYYMSAQVNYDEIQRKQDSIYQVNIKKSRINGVYIPKSLEDAFEELTALSTTEARMKFKNAPEIFVAKKLHFGLGQWMRINWNFDQGSRLTDVLRGYGIYHPDDMVNFMLRSYHRYLNGVDQDIVSRVKEYKEKRKKEAKENRGHDYSKDKSSIITKDIKTGTQD